MRVLFVTFPWRTHFQALVPLAWAVQTAGHEVRVASGPELTGTITRSGLTAVPVGSDEPVFEKLERSQAELYQKLVAEVGERDDILVDLSENREEELTWERLLWGFRFLTETFKAMNDAMVEELVEYCRWWQPDLVLWDSLSHAGSIAAAATGAVHARLPTEIDVEGRMRRHFLRVREQQAPQDRADPLGEWLAGWAQRYGVPFSEEMVTGQFGVEQMLGSLRVPSDVPHIAVRALPYNGPSTVPDWARRDPAKRRVLATFGLTLEKDPASLAFSVEQLQEMLDALADLDIELVVTLPEQLQKELRRVPANTRMVEFVPLHVIIPSCSAVIHHGGVPAFLDAIAHGIPQLMVGRALQDIGERGPRMERAGAGRWIPGDDAAQLSGAHIRDELVRLLDEPAFREGAGRLREELLAQPTPAEAVRELELLADRHRRR
ncbi:MULTISPECIES: activator-dependent family glycosyltransferase [Streptomyces]|uniref:activator-dependent family glycosyltransferase n=1 Tax=Streptomyces TaxID=1883 RepID=UPI001E39F0E7|nr:MULTISPECIES: activator-dependent family glycosyltransferase [Streptomyces]UFQ18669.1 activator-dependent family glycosyltransferase [Streptomyces huasconensis]WCL88286.1 activator-dependent family glycosyltransferase [Streptomyces sp. JCM 35825]